MLMDFQGGIGTSAGPGWIHAFSAWMAYPWPSGGWDYIVRARRRGRR